MAEGLPVSRVVDVDVNFVPVAAPPLAFDTLLIMGDTEGIIPTGEGVRDYGTLEEVAHDFGTTTPEFYAAELYFAQQPQPNTVFIGRWASLPSSGSLLGGRLTAAQKKMASWNAITNGEFSIIVNGVESIVGSLNFSACTSLEAVAAVIDAAWTTGKISWDTNVKRNRFVLRSNTKGPNSTLSYGSAVVSTPPGVNIAPKLRITDATTEFHPVAGLPAETPIQAIVRVDGRGWYAATFAAKEALTNAEHMAVGAYLEATSEKHLYGITTASTAVLDPLITTDLASQLSLADYSRTIIQYYRNPGNPRAPYAITSIFGRAFSTNFEGSNTTITLKFKREPLLVPTFLTTTQADTLMLKRCNSYVGYNNDTAIFQEGVMSGPAYFDEMHGLDWLSNRIQNDLWNLLYQSPKVPQTNSGVHSLLTRCENSLNQAVTNGLVAPGVWNAPGFGQLYDGAFLGKGWYTYADSVDNQNQSIREQRIAPLIQIAVKLAGAVHFSSVLINVNR